jgi:hypothetical protein
MAALRVLRNAVTGEIDAGIPVNRSSRNQTSQNQTSQNREPQKDGREALNKVSF